MALGRSVHTHSLTMNTSISASQHSLSTHMAVVVMMYHDDVFTLFSLSSANILLDKHFIPKLSDFGLARELSSQSGRSSTFSSRSVVVMGTMAYMAPEYMRNHKLTTLTDVYAYGVVLLELHTGQPAFSEDQSLHERVLVGRLCDAHM